MLNSYYSNSITTFISQTIEEVIGTIARANAFDQTLTQVQSWGQQIIILKNALENQIGQIYFEFSIPRMGKRVDCLLIIKNIVFVIEFKVGQAKYLNYDIDQVWDYALDLKNFHHPSHKIIIVPILVSTEAKSSSLGILFTRHEDNLVTPLKSSAQDLKNVIENVLAYLSDDSSIDSDQYEKGSYSPTPTIIEAAVSLYNSHSVKEITRNDAKAINLSKTSAAISDIIDYAKTKSKKVICFVTGVPGAGKTLVGLNVATAHLDKEKGNTSVYLSGNAPLVAILQEALTRDKVANEKLKGHKISKRLAKEGVKAFIQIIHHYRDAYLVDENPPFDHVAIFDEAQRAWNKEQTVKFMKQKKNKPDFDHSEPEFLISCLDRHPDWAVVVCLVGGGQEINTGEAGISEWLNAVNEKFPKWEVNISPHLADSEYAAVDSIARLNKRGSVSFNENLHLSVSMRSFRAEKVSSFVKCLLDRDQKNGEVMLSDISENYPIVLTRDLKKAKDWVRSKARGSERYGLIVSSEAQRLKPLAIDVKSPMNPVNWFLEGKEDVRSSYFMENVATEFQIQGLEIDWACVTWDGDLRYSTEGWKTYSFVGNKWQNIHSPERKKYLINAYRVLLTRARQGMVIVLPEGNESDATRKPEFYDTTFKYLKNLGIEVL